MQRLLIFLLLGFQIISAQKLVADHVHGVDDFGNFYHSRYNVFYKQTGNQPLQYFEPQLGDLTSVDLINPLKVILFYRDTQTLVILDNRLNERQRMVFSEIQPYRYVQFVGLAGERRLWLFNQDTMTLDLFDYINNRKVLSTPPVASEVIAMGSDFNFCYLLTEDEVLLYNIYGSLLDRKPLKQPRDISVDFDKAVVLTESGFTAFAKANTKKLKPLTTLSAIDSNGKEIPLKNLPKSLSKGGVDFFLHDEFLYLYKKNNLTTYTLKETK